jgi:hypothetical protein
MLWGILYTVYTISNHFLFQAIWVKQVPQHDVTTRHRRALRVRDGGRVAFSHGQTTLHVSSLKSSSSSRRSCSRDATLSPTTRSSYKQGAEKEERLVKKLTSQLRAVIRQVLTPTKHTNCDETQTASRTLHLLPFLMRQPVAV